MECWWVGLTRHMQLLGIGTGPADAHFVAGKHPESVQLKWTLLQNDPRPCSHVITGRLQLPVRNAPFAARSAMQLANALPMANQMARALASTVSGRVLLLLAASSCWSVEEHSVAADDRERRCCHPSSAPSGQAVPTKAVGVRERGGALGFCCCCWACSLLNRQLAR